MEPRKSITGPRENVLAAQIFCKCAPQEGKDFVCFQIFLYVEFFTHFTNRKKSLKISEFWKMRENILRKHLLQVRTLGSYNTFFFTPHTASEGTLTHPCCRSGNWSPEKLLQHWRGQDLNPDHFILRLDYIIPTSGLLCVLSFHAKCLTTERIVFRISST